MNLSKMNLGLAAAAIAAFVAAAPIEASATHKLGHDIAVGVGVGVGVGIGLGLLGAATKPRPVYVQPQPVYQQPRRVIVQEPVYDEEVCYKRRVWAPDGYGGRVQVIRLICE